VALPSPPPAGVTEDDALVPIRRDDAARGSRAAPVTLVVFSDFECPYCGKLEKTIARLRGEYGEEKLRIVFKNFPLAGHPHARLAAEIGEAVRVLGGEGAFWRYHATVFRDQATMSAESLREAAIAVGVDGAAIDEGLSSGRWAEKVNRDLALARALRIEGAPGSFVNGVSMEGAKPFDAFRELIDKELDKARAMAGDGVPPDEIYKRAVAQNFVPPEDDAAAEAAAKAAEAAEARVVHKVPLGTSPTRGAASGSGALVTIVEFADFACSYCKRAEKTLEEIRSAYGDKVRFVWRDLPLDMHTRAEPAAELARGARAQGGDAAFWQVHDLLFASQGSLDDADLERIARNAKVDPVRAMGAVKSHSFRRALDADADLADDLQVDGTPCFFVNGRRIAGAKPLPEWTPILDEEIAKSEALLRAGTAKSALYDTLIKDGVPLAEPEKRALAAPPPSSPFRGSAKGKIVIQEVGDFQCAFCARAEATVDDLLRAYPGQLKVVWRDKPLSFHADAALAAEAAREAFAQKGADGFEKMHKLLFANPRALKREDLEGYARSVGLDLKKFVEALDTHKHKAAVDADEKLTTDAGIHGTPAFFVGPYLIQGAQSFGKFRRVAELAGAVAPSR
jgi:protein-disulfide isomerase